MYINNITLLTPFSGNLKDLKLIIKKNVNELACDDKWIIVLDNIDAHKPDLVDDSRITYLSYIGEKGAGNARNFGLSYIKETLKFPLLLLPIDGDDIIVPGAVELIKTVSNSIKDNMISFGHIKKWPDRQIAVSYEGFYRLDDLLKRYITPCGSTVLKIGEERTLNKIQFSIRKRANDNLFFLTAAQYFGGFRCWPDPVLIYNVGNPKSLSGKKYKQIFYKYLALRDFGLSRHYTFYLLVFYIINGVKRYVLRKSL
jgi:glycosyltransferase involved in cell wall biosynthesis